MHSSWDGGVGVLSGGTTGASATERDDNFNGGSGRNEKPHQDRPLDSVLQTGKELMESLQLELSDGVEANDFDKSVR